MAQGCIAAVHFNCTNVRKGAQMVIPGPDVDVGRHMDQVARAGNQILVK